MWAEYEWLHVFKVLVKGLPNDPSWKIQGRWTNEYLIDKAGDCIVSVEKKEARGDRFGRGRRTAVPFKVFLNKIADGDEDLYLSPQEASEDVDGIPEVLSAPLTYLQDDFPLRPKLMGNLIPHQVNVWMGAATEGTSSGLHHDYHDNLYVLIKGKKRFKLYSASHARNMYTVGKISEIHKNGRVVYEGQPPTMSDGCTVEAFAAFQAMNVAKEALAKAEDSGDKDALRDAENLLEALMEETLDKALEGGDSQHGDDEDSEDEDSEDENNPESDSAWETKVVQDPIEPLNFSRVDLLQPMSNIKEQYPDFPDEDCCYECVVEEGNMLYLPAGWFHEVTSFNVDPTSPGHIAQNYWFHPPDNLDAQEGYKQPYLTDFWATKWAFRIEDDGVRHTSLQDDFKVDNDKDNDDDDDDGSDGSSEDFPPDAAETASNSGSDHIQKKQKVDLS